MSQLPWHFYIYDVSIFHLSLHSFPYYPAIADVGLSISLIPGPPFGPS